MSEEIKLAAEQIKAAGASAVRWGRDPVNLPMINNWVEAIGDSNPIYVSDEAAKAAGHAGAVAPPAMIQVWTMPGLHGARTADDPIARVMALLDDAGYTSIVATNAEQTYHRYLHHDERVGLRTELQELFGPKQTGLGEGWFFTVRNVWYVGDEPVAEMLFRMLKFRPGSAKPAGADRSATLRPVVSLDTEFFWEGTAAGELRIQRCGVCATLRNPPGPMCQNCGAEQTDYVLASGRGSVFSYVVHHHPRVPGKTPPFVIALVELDEGVRMLGEMVDVDPAAVHIGMPVEVAFTKVDDELTLPLWRPVQ
jgi:uncharacterized OB-fold protein